MKDDNLPAQAYKRLVVKMLCPVIIIEINIIDKKYEPCNCHAYIHILKLLVDQICILFGHIFVYFVDRHLAQMPKKKKKICKSLRLSRLMDDFFSALQTDVIEM